MIAWSGPVSVLWRQRAAGFDRRFPIRRATCAAGRGRRPSPRRSRPRHCISVSSDGKNPGVEQTNPHTFCVSPETGSTGGTFCSGFSKTTMLGSYVTGTTRGKLPTQLGAPSEIPSHHWRSSGGLRTFWIGRICVAGQSDVKAAGGPRRSRSRRLRRHLWGSRTPIAKRVARWPDACGCGGGCVGSD